MTEEYKVYPKPYVALMEAHSRFRHRGWIVAGFFFVAAIGVLVSDYVLLSRFNEAVAEQRAVTVLQVSTGQAIIDAWDEQHARDETFRTWSEYVSARDSITRFNRKVPKSFKEAQRNYNP